MTIVKIGDTVKIVNRYNIIVEEKVIAKTKNQFTTASGERFSIKTGKGISSVLSKFIYVL